MEHYGFNKDSIIQEIMKWQYLDKAREGDTSALLGQLLQVSWKRTYNVTLRRIRATISAVETQ